MKKKSSQPPQMASIRVLREVLTYDPHTGMLTWRKTVNGRAKAGQVAGCVRADGFRVVRYLKVRYLASRIAWALSYDEWPIGFFVSHRNGDNSDDRLANLVLTDANGVHANRFKPDGSSTSGYLGVIRLSGGWVARFNNKRIGTFDTAEQAAMAYWAHKRRIGVLYRPDELMPNQGIAYELE